MSGTVITGPFVTTGGGGNTTSESASPSVFYAGACLYDPRFAYGGGWPNNTSTVVYGFAPGMMATVIDQVPSTAATNNIAAAANVSSGVAMTLVSSSGAGITVMTAAQTIPQNGNVVPACLAIDGQPAVVNYTGQNAVALADPTKAVARSISITGVSGGSGGAFKIVGYGLYGNLMHETLTATAGATTTNSAKTYKFILSVTPQFSDAHNYSVGTADIYGLPLRADSYGYVYACFNNAPVTSPSFTAAVTTTATATSGDVRGTIVVTSDGTKRLQVMMGIPAANLVTTNNTGLFGVPNFAA